MEISEISQAILSPFLYKLRHYMGIMTEMMIVLSIFITIITHDHTMKHEPQDDIVKTWVLLCLLGYTIIQVWRLG